MASYPDIVSDTPALADSVVAEAPPYRRADSLHHTQSVPDSLADHKIWAKVDAALRALKSDGRSSITILDVGCGSGTWLLRAARRACEMGFTNIRVRGFDVSEHSIRDARRNMGACECEFEVTDFAAPLIEEANSVDLTLSLSGMLNHLPGETHEGVIRELDRVTSGHLLLAVRTAGSLPTIFVDRIENARRYVQDHNSEQLVIDMADGSHLSLVTHLFSATELLDLFEPFGVVPRLIGLDVFHSLFSSDPRWNPTILPYADLFQHELQKLENTCSGSPAFLDRAEQILLHADYTR